jgi:hypothetical protein
MPKIPEGVFTDEQLQRINGGWDVCSAEEWRFIFANLQQNYETLIDFTSYVIERVATSLPGSGQ